MKILKFLNENIEKYMCVLLFSVMIAIMIINIFMRFVAKNAIPWASDAILFIFVWFVWFSISYGFKEDSHVRVTVVTSMFPEKVNRVLDIVINIIMLVGFTILLIFGIKLLTDVSVVGKTGLLIKYPMWSLYISTPIGLTLSLIRIIQNTYYKLKNTDTKKEANI